MLTIAYIPVRFWEKANIVLQLYSIVFIGSKIQVKVYNICYDAVNIVCDVVSL